MAATTPPVRRAEPSGSLRETPSQTAGPYVHIGLAPRSAGLDVHPRELGADVAGPDASGERIRIEGRVLDGAGEPVGDALIELWQADGDGRHARSGVRASDFDARPVTADGTGPALHDDAPTASAFRGWGRVVPDPDTGCWRLDTVKPGATCGADGRAQAPHLALWIVARGINLGLSTRLYFDDEAAANERDPVLALVEPDRRATLIATREGGPSVLYRFDVRLRGEDETVFFDV